MAQEHSSWIRTGAIAAASVTTSLAAGAAAGIAYSALAIDHALPLPPAIAADRRSVHSATAGAVSYYADDTASGRPLLLIHSVNAAASAYEMRPLFDRYRSQRPVYAVDLPGFGFSERSNRVYSPVLYTTAVREALGEVTRSREAADVVALSLGCEFAARAAVQEPERVRSLALISPTGLTAPAQRNRSERAGESGAGASISQLFRFPLWSQAFYDALASRWSIRYFLQKSFVGAPDPGLLAYAYATSHQPGARFAPLQFVSGQLFSPDIGAAIYEQLPMPVVALYDQDPFVRFDALTRVLARNPHWRAMRIAPSKGLPQFERLDETTQALNTFWQDIEAGSTEPSASLPPRDLSS
jgi:pimeloyl-ACP methyl ester carboxylesterase